MTDVTTIEITVGARDALYAQALDHLSGIDGVYRAAVNEDFTTAERLGREFADELRLIEELGWGFPPTGESVELAMSAEQLHRRTMRVAEVSERVLEIVGRRPPSDPG